MSIISQRVLQRWTVSRMMRRGSCDCCLDLLSKDPRIMFDPQTDLESSSCQLRWGFYCSEALFRPISNWVLDPTPHTWARTADESTRRDVEATMSVAFNTARAGPARKCHKKLREATFHVPHELARLNKDAPRFRLEDLGPLGPGKLPWVTGLRSVSKDGPPLDAKTETRAFLYFPNGSPKATAIFLAVNSELMYPRKGLTQSPPVQEDIAWSRKPTSLLAGFRVVYKDWEENRPSVTARIVETSRLPVICNFQESVFGCIFYPVPNMVPNTRMGLTPLDVTDFDRKTSML